MSAGWRTGARAPCCSLFLPWTLPRSHGWRGELAGRGRAGTAAGRAPRRPLPPWDSSVGFGFIFNNVFPSGLSPPTLDSVARSRRGPGGHWVRGCVALGRSRWGSPAPLPPPGGWMWPPIRRAPKAAGGHRFALCWPRARVHRPLYRAGGGLAPCGETRQKLIYIMYSLVPFWILTVLFFYTLFKP